MKNYARTLTEILLHEWTRKEKTMSMSAKAILARFQGDYQDALEYARGIARAYPRLAEEYWRYVDEIGWERMKNTSLKRGEL